MHNDGMIFHRWMMEHIDTFRHGGQLRFRKQLKAMITKGKGSTGRRQKSRVF